MGATVKGTVFAISVAASLGTVALAGLLSASLQKWFGVSDLRFLIIGFVPAGLMAGLISVSLLRKVSHWGLLIRYLLGIGLGLAVGFLWTACVAGLLGPWWSAASLPALMCWMAGGASGVAGGLVLGPGSSALSRIGSVVGLVGLAGSMVVANRPLNVYLSQDQTLSVRFLKWTPGGEPLTIETEREDALSDAEVALIRDAEPTGRVLVLWGGGTHGRGPAASVLILLKKPITLPVTLQQPDRATALYVQGPHGFVMHPAGTRTLDREITLSQYDGGVWCSVRIANGGTQGSPVRVW
jgi:hypothetical protein